MSDEPDVFMLAMWANNGEAKTEFNQRNCECDVSVGHAPCQYCAIHDALTKAKKLERKLAEARAELNILRLYNDNHIKVEKELESHKEYNAQLAYEAQAEIAKLRDARDAYREALKLLMSSDYIRDQVGDVSILMEEYPNHPISRAMTVLAKYEVKK
jgi:hypothetical protein